MGLKKRLAECHKAAHEHTHLLLLVVLSSHTKAKFCAHTHRHLKKKKKRSVSALRRADTHTRTLPSADPHGQTCARTVAVASNELQHIVSEA